MNNAVKSMLSKYKCQSLSDYDHALKEIIQEIALLGLWRAKFFEKAAFYGGTALRIFHGLDRFSEDMDFSLLRPNSKFDIGKYCSWVENELNGFGFNVKIEKKEKIKDSAVQSAFIKTGTLQNMILINTPEQFINKIHLNQTLKIKLEVDIDPPANFETEAKYLLQPIPFSVNVYTPPDLFAGKLHALLCRQWKERVKGRDWYDFVWSLGRHIPVHLKHLEARMKQTGHLPTGTKMTKAMLIDLLQSKIEKVNFEDAKKDVFPMIKDPQALAVWSKGFFSDITSSIEVI
jgi:predicted nucleotidyltransferase component of viral defense system